MSIEYEALVDGNYAGASLLGSAIGGLWGVEGKE